MPSIHCYLNRLLKSRRAQTLAVGAAVPALLLAVAACGATASASPSAGSSSSPGGTNAYLNCLREHGVTGFGTGSSSGSSSSGSSSSGSSSSSSTINSARQACASLRPSGGFGGSSGGFSAAFGKFESCLSAHGVTLPSPSASGGGFRSVFSELQSTPAGQAALNACKSDLPFTPGSGGYGGSSGGYGGSGGGSTTT